MSGFRLHRPEDPRGVRFARVVFLAAGIWGVLLFVPMYFTELLVPGAESPAQFHPENFYGFVGVGLAWQVAFLIVSRDPQRFRPLIPAALIEKFAFGLAALILGAYGRVPASLVGFGLIDLLLGVLFAISYQML
ncbi:hypothetical protein [uncultured Paludibaculum sp.]|uniref:hypothetical protein n=1 Tax=uncultured Paludibaculum sp. TaxID=1765020 RepID=UPI002AAB4C5B|nr:hypothetical protein [uncultured Paludibaculum sp.]